MIYLVQKKVSKEVSNRLHEASLKQVLSVLKRLKVDYRVVSRSHRNSSSKGDLILTVGGDGTFLKASHWVTHERMLGINSAPNYSVGALCSITAKNFEEKIKDILKGESRVGQLQRLSIRVNGRLLREKALNDVLFANTCPAGTTRYRIFVDGREENQKSSGIWVASPSGSTSAIYAAGGKQLPRTSKKLQYLVREPFRGDGGKSLLHGFFRKKIRLINKTLKSALYIDGTQFIHPLKFGDRIEISLSQNPLNVIL